MRPQFLIANGAPAFLAEHIDSCHCPVILSDAKDLRRSTPNTRNIVHSRRSDGVLGTEHRIPRAARTPRPRPVILSAREGSTSSDTQMLVNTSNQGFRIEQPEWMSPRIHPRDDLIRPCNAHPATCIELGTRSPPDRRCIN